MNKEFTVKDYHAFTFYGLDESDQTSLNKINQIIDQSIEDDIVKTGWGYCESWFTTSDDPIVHHDPSVYCVIVRCSFHELFDVRVAFEDWRDFNKFHEMSMSYSWLDDTDYISEEDN